jgi:hypothetical protein
MNKETILNNILVNKKLQEKYWPEIKPEEHNLQTLAGSTNRYVKCIHYLVNEASNKRNLYNSIFNLFKI